MAELCTTLGELGSLTYGVFLKSSVRWKTDILREKLSEGVDRDIAVHELPQSYQRHGAYEISFAVSLDSSLSYDAIEGCARNVEIIVSDMEEQLERARGIALPLSWIEDKPSIE